MPTSPFILSQANVVDFAKDTLYTSRSGAPFGLKCQWGQCDAVLNSWRQLQKHQHSHCRKEKMDKGRSTETIFRCHLPNCSATTHESETALKNHVDLSHMSRIRIPCPIRGCLEQFVRHHNLPDHLVSDHAELVNCSINLPSDILQPTWRPYLPSVPPPIPPPIPKGLPTWHAIFTPAATGCTTKRKPIAIQPPYSPRKSQIWNRSGFAIKANDESESIELGDLVQGDLDYSEKGMQMRDFVVRRKPPEGERALARAQMVFKGQMKKVETSMGYETFAKRVDFPGDTDLLQ